MSLSIRKIISKLKIFYNKKYNYSILKKSGAAFSTFNINGRIFIKNNGFLKIGQNFSANSGINANPIGGDTLLRLIVHLPESRLILGDNIGMSNSTIYCWQEITIGNNVLIGGSVKIWDTNFHSTNSTTRLSKNDINITSAPINICDNVFIGAGTIILKGVTIGENSIIAAGSVVVKSIPPNVIAGGNPCLVVKDIAL